MVLKGEIRVVLILLLNALIVFIVMFIVKTGQFFFDFDFFDFFLILNRPNFQFHGRGRES